MQVQQPGGPNLSLRGAQAWEISEKVISLDAGWWSDYDGPKKMEITFEGVQHLAEQHTLQKLNNSNHHWVEENNLVWTLHPFSILESNGFLQN